MTDQKSVVNMDDTLRLGNYECTLKKDTLAYADYKKDKILERHRHRYEFNNKYKVILEKTGLVFSGINEQTELVEVPAEADLVPLPTKEESLAIIKTSSIRNSVSF